MANAEKSITFDLPADQARVIRAIAGERKVRLGATLVGNAVRIDFIACNAPFVACNAPFVACNAPFVITKYGPYDKLQG
jgi:hypothetical protein